MGHVSSWTAPAETLQRRGSGVRRLGIGVLGISGVSGGSQAAGREPRSVSAWWDFVSQGGGL